MNLENLVPGSWPILLFFFSQQHFIWYLHTKEKLQKLYKTRKNYNLQKLYIVN